MVSPPRAISPNAPAEQIVARRATTRRILIVCLILFSTLLITGIIAFRHAGRWLIREDPLARADAIVVLSGSMPSRAERAAALYHHGYAPEIWLTRPQSPAEELARIGIHYVGEDDYNRDVLIHLGVPASAIRILPGEIVDTEQEIDDISAQMRDLLSASALSRKSAVIIVTSPQHTRRVRALWRRLAGSNQVAVVRAAWEDPFDARHWWRNTRDAYSVVREILGLANAWTGLVVRPHSA